MEKMTVKEAAAKWGISEDAVRKMCREGKIAGAEKLSTGWSIPADAKLHTEESKAGANGNQKGTGVASDKQTPLQDAKTIMKNMLAIAFGFIVFVALAIVGLVLVFSGEAVFIGGILAAFGGLCVWAMCAMFKEKNKVFKELKANEEANGGKTIKKLLFKICAACISVVVIAGILTVVGFGIYGGIQMNMRADWLLDDAVGEGIFEEIDSFDEYYAKRDGLSKLFFTKQDEVDAKKAEAEAFLENKAQEVENQIAALEPVKDITTADQQREIYNKIREIQLYSDDEFEARLKEKVSNYNEFEAYVDNYNAICDRHTITKSCSSCGGDGRYSCSYCGGSGKCLVTWYEHGDWGEKSYTSYDCTRCNGRGRGSCGTCGGDGVYSYYDFEE